MTKKELMEVQCFMSAVRSAASDIDYYNADFDCRDLSIIADNLREALSEFRKTVKL